MTNAVKKITNQKWMQANLMQIYLLRIFLKQVLLKYRTSFILVVSFTTLFYCVQPYFFVHSSETK